MICKACGEAGDMLAAARTILDKPLSRLALDVIRLKHQECAGRTACDCLHRIT